MGLLEEVERKKEEEEAFLADLRDFEEEIRKYEEAQGLPENLENEPALFQLDLEALEKELREREPRRSTIFDGKYRLTGNAFNGNFHTWRMLTNRNLPENETSEDHRKKDEARVVARVASEAAKLSSIKVAFHKTIRFEREKDEIGQNGEVLYDRMEHFFKSPRHIITRETTKKEIRDLYRQDMDNIQEEIEQWE